jgi:hypothetical protein
MEAKDAGGLERDQATAIAERALATAILPPWSRRVAFWRALAGMAFAIAIACAVVTVEFSSALIERSRHYHNRLRQLSSNIATMRGEIAGADREIAGMRTTVEVDDGLRRIIAEPDSRLIRLETQRPSRASGVIAFSPRLGRAAIEIDGVPALPVGHVYTLRWMRGKRGSLEAEQISPGAADTAALIIALPSGSEAIEGAVLTMDTMDSTTDLPTSMTALAGVVTLKASVVFARDRVQAQQR